MITIKENEINIQSSMLPGSEGKTFLTDLGIYKKFHETVNDEIRLIKIQQLYYLETLKNIKNYFPELRYIVEDERILGYIMEQIKGFNLGFRVFNYETKIFLLKIIKKRLNNLANNDILYLDIRDPNIVIEEHEDEINETITYSPKFLDTDSITIKGYYENHIPICLDKYIANGGKIDRKAQNFMFNCYTADVLSWNKPIYDKQGEKIIKQSKKNMVDSYADNEILLHHIINHTR